MITFLLIYLLQERIQSTLPPRFITDMAGEEGRRRVQVVSSKSERKKVIEWMIAQPSHHNIASKAVEQFPLIFSQRSRSANREKAGRWWRGRLCFLASLQIPTKKALFVSTRNTRGVIAKKIPVKALPGRGRKRQEWTNILHGAMKNEFERLRKLGVKFHGRFLQEMGLRLLMDPDVPLSISDVEQQTGKYIEEVITVNWIQNFKSRFNIVSRARTSNTSLSAAKVQYYNKRMAYMLGNIKRDYDNGMQEEDVENLDETHMVFDMDNGRVLDYSGSKRITYAEISSAGQGFTVVVRITGANGGRIETPMVIFQNALRSYPIAGCPDNIDGVCYRSSPKGWMDKDLFGEYFTESRTITALPNERIRKLYIDNCRVHAETVALMDALGTINTELIRFPPNCTHLIQPLDQILLRKIKAEFRKRWEKFRADAVIAGIFTSTGRIPNPGKHFYLEMVRDVVDEINSRIDAGMSESRRALIMCGMVPSSDGVWEIEQLTPELQSIVHEFPTYFDGAVPEETS